MPRPYSVDLRERVLLACERGGASCAELARRFRVGVSTLHLWRKQARDEGRRALRPMGRGPAPLGGGLLVVALEVFELPWLPVLGIVAALCGVGVAGWFAAHAESIRTLETALAGAFAAGVAVVTAARFLLVHLADPGARMADGSSVGDAIVRIERLWPARPDRLHILAHNTRLSRGMVLELRGGQPVRYLRGD